MVSINVRFLHSPVSSKFNTVGTHMFTCRVENDVLVTETLRGKAKIMGIDFPKAFFYSLQIFFLFIIF